MVLKFKIGDRVTWNSEAGRVSGTIIKVHTRNVDFKGYTHHASEDDPQYEIKSSKTDHIAMHKASALKKRTTDRPSLERHSHDRNHSIAQAGPAPLAR